MGRAQSLSSESAIVNPITVRSWSGSYPGLYWVGQVFREPALLLAPLLLYLSSSLPLPSSNSVLLSLYFTKVALNSILLPQPPELLGLQLYPLVCWLGWDTRVLGFTE